MTTPIIACAITAAVLSWSAPVASALPGPILAGDATQAPSESSIVTPVFVEQNFHVTQPRNIARARVKAVDTTVKSGAFGSAFAYRTGGRVLLVTAAHVVALPGKVEAVASKDGTQFATSDGETKIEAGPARIRVGGASIRPARVLVDESQDIALLEVSPADLAALRITTLESGTVARDAEVKIWGFPAVVPKPSGPKDKPAPIPSASQSSQRTDVTDVRRGEVVCAPLNGVETRGGFSGGPLVASNGKVVGMIMRSTSETTRCRAMSAIDELAKGFEQRATPYVEKAPPTATN